MKLEGTERLLSLGNVEKNGTPRSSRTVNLLVTPTGTQAVKRRVHISLAWTVPRLNVPSVKLVKESVRRTWKHLQDSDVLVVSTDQIGLLIGVQVAEAMIQHEHRRGPKGQPYAVGTDFGWAVAGVAGGVPNPRPEQSFVGHCVAMDDALKCEVEHWWKTESFRTKFSEDISRSPEDERALKYLEETGVLWKNAQPLLPNNRSLAERRLGSLQRSLDKDSKRPKS